MGYANVPAPKNQWISKFNGLVKDISLSVDAIVYIQFQSFLARDIALRNSIIIAIEWFSTATDTRSIMNLEMYQVLYWRCDDPSFISWIHRRGHVSKGEWDVYWFHLINLSVRLYVNRLYTYPAVCRRIRVRFITSPVLTAILSLIYIYIYTYIYIYIYIYIYPQGEVMWRITHSIFLFK